MRHQVKCNLQRASAKIFRRLRLGVIGLNVDSFRFGNHQTGECETCGVLETVDHILVDCPKYLIERAMLSAEINNFDMYNISMLLNSEDASVQGALVRFVQRTNRISM